MLRCILGLSIALASLIHASYAVAGECQKVNILKKFVGIPDMCSVDSCETWKSSAALGSGEWLLESTFSNFRPSVVQPDPNGFVIFGTVSDTFTAKNGDVMYAMNAVSANVNSPVGAGIMYVNGGTGRFAEASGRLFIRVDNENGRAVVDGELCGIKGMSVLD